MKKLLVLFLFSIFLTSCGVVEEIPDDAVVGECSVGDTYKYIYKDALVYEFYFNDVLQDEGMLSVVQTAVDNLGTAREYLDTTFGEGVCTFTTFKSE